MAGGDSDRFIEVRHRCVDVSYRRLRNAAIVVGHHGTRIPLERLTEVGQSTSHVAFAKPEIAPVVKGRRQTWTDIERPRVILNRPGKLAASFIRKTAIEVSRSELRCELKCDVVSRNGSLEVSVVRKLVAEVDIGGRRFLARLGCCIPNQSCQTECKRKTPKCRFHHVNHPSILVQDGRAN